MGSDGTIYVGAGSFMVALTSDGSVKWNYQTGANTFSIPAIGSDGTIYFGSFDYYIYALTSDGSLNGNT